MRIDARRAYFNAVLGGSGGLLGWALISLLAPGPGANGPALGHYLAYAWKGALIGLAIGAGVGAADGLVTNRSPRRAARGAAYGAGLGAMGGVVGMLIGEFLFNLLGGGLFVKALGWSIFGGWVGTCDGIAQKMPNKVRYGAVGGLIGGLVGGGTYERIARVLIAITGDRSLGLALGGAIGLVILGACIGAFMGLVESILRRAWLVFFGGRNEGQSHTLDPGQVSTTLGSSDDCSIVVRDSGVSDRHAEITVANERFQIAPRGGRLAFRDAAQREGPARVLNGPQPLHDGDEVEMGAARFVFHSSEAPAP